MWCSENWHAFVHLFAFFQIIYGTSTFFFRSRLLEREHELELDTDSALHCGDTVFSYCCDFLAQDISNSPDRRCHKNSESFLHGFHGAGGKCCFHSLWSGIASSTALVRISRASRRALFCVTNMAWLEPVSLVNHSCLSTLSRIAVPTRVPQEWHELHVAELFLLKSSLIYVPEKHSTVVSTLLYAWCNFFVVVAKLKYPALKKQT